MTRRNTYLFSEIGRQSLGAHPKTGLCPWPGVSS